MHDHRLLTPMRALGRRDLLAGVAALAVGAALPARAAPASDARLRAVLDGLSELPDYAQRLAALTGFEERLLPLAAQIDLHTVKRALAIDAALVRLVPGGKTDGPYRLSNSAEPGLWRRANGAPAYALLIERQTGAPASPEATHRRFERAAAGLAARADRLLRGAGYVRGSLGERFRTAFADPRGLYADSDAGRDAAVADMNRWLDKGRAELPALIGAVPRASLQVSVQRLSREEEAAGKQGYRRMPAPGTAGAYFVDLKHIRRRPRWTLASVAHHELLPGHMVQLPIEAEAGAHPLRIAYLPAFAEAWAVYAEQMMADRGFYRSAPMDALGHVHWLLFRVMRGLADTGIHHRRWSVERARAEVERVQGVPAYFAPFETDLARIAAEPGIRAAEALVWLGLADRTRGLSGAALRRANYQILCGGRKPLRMVEGRA